MPKWEDINKAGEERRTFAVERQKMLRRKVKSLQRWLYLSLLEKVVSALETDENGRIKNNIRNIRTANTAGGVFLALQAEMSRPERVSIKDGKKTVTGGLMSWLVRGVVRVLKLNRKYTNIINRDFDAQTIEERAIAKYFAQLGWKDGKVVSGSWLNGLAASSDAKQMIVSRMQRAISSGMDKRTFQKAFKDEMVGGGRRSLGLLERHFDTHTRNIFMSVDRSIANEYAEAAGLDYFVYSGSVVDDTRPFCLDKKGKIFHISIYDKWNGQRWQGKIEGADTKTALGGHNCKDHARAISAGLARTLISRGRKHGLTASQLEELMRK